MSIQNMSASAFAALSPEAKEARIAEQWATEKAANLIEWRSKNPEKVAEFAKKAREITAQWLEDRRIMKETNLEAFVAMIKNEAPGCQDPSRHTYLEERTLTANFMRDQAIAERNAQRAAKLAERNKK